MLFLILQGQRSFSLRQNNALPSCIDHFTFPQMSTLEAIAKNKGCFSCLTRSVPVGLRLNGCLFFRKTSIYILKWQVQSRCIGIAGLRYMMLNGKPQSIERSLWWEITSWCRLFTKTFQKNPSLLRQILRAQIRFEIVPGGVAGLR